MFASRTPRDLNRDPVPYVERAGVVFYEPRPKFDHVQRNPVNPILAIVRQTPSITAHSWLNKPLLRGELPMSAYTPEEIDHARRVLTRLANLTKEDYT